MLINLYEGRLGMELKVTAFQITQGRADFAVYSAEDAILAMTRATDSQEWPPLTKCKACGVESLGAPADHDCERDAWARPLPQAPNATGKDVPDIFKDLERDGIGS